jgi:hypothetical protein
MREEITDKFEKVENFKDELYKKKDKLIKDEKELEGLRTKLTPEVQ